jgi:MoaA/NifB/PqqE/SkfB family radical SAM enzyme
MRGNITNRVILREWLRQTPMIVKDCIVNNVIKWYKELAPTVMQLNVTLKCNSRCLTCNIWKGVPGLEFSTKEWQDALSDPFLKTIEHLLISGGEPTLRSDLPKIVQTCLDNMPRLRKLLIATNGLSPSRSRRIIPPIVECCTERNVNTTITVSLDGIGSRHDQIRGIPGHFEKTKESLEFYERLQQRLGFRLNIGTTISKQNADNLEEILRFGRSEGLPSVFYMAWISGTYYRNSELSGNIVIPAPKKSELIQFFKDRVSETGLLNGHAYYYSKMIGMLQGSRRRFPCPFADQGLILDAEGQVFYCSNSRAIGKIGKHDSLKKIYYSSKNLEYRKRLRDHICPKCQSSCLSGVSLQKTIFPFVHFLITQAIRRI